MLLGGVLFLLPLAFSNAFVAFLVWGWTALIAIDNYSYGFMQDLRLNLIFGLITLAMVMAARDNVRGSWKDNRVVLLLFLYLFQATLSAVFAYGNNPINFDLYEKFVKTLLFVLVMPIVLVGRYRIHALIIMLCLGLGFHGIIDGLKFLASGGGHIVGGFKKFGDNNHFAVALAMVIPLLLYLSNTSSYRSVRWVCLGGAFLVIAAVIGTRSRGGFLSLIAVGLWLIVSSGQRFKGLLLFGGGLVLILALAPSSWMERMDTIKSADQDSSFMSRVEAWQVSSSIALHNPLLGGGFHSVQVQSVWSEFRGNGGLLGFIDIGEPSRVFRAAHSIYFEVMGDFGFIGFILFMTILINAIISGRKIRLLVKPLGPDFEWASGLSIALTGVIIAFMVGGASVSLAYSEFIYIVVMLMEILRQEVTRLVNASSASVRDEVAESSGIYSRDH